MTNDDIMEFCPTVEVPDVGIDTIILDCSTWSFIDSMGVKALTSVSATVIYMLNKGGEGRVKGFMFEKIRTGLSTSAESSL